VGAFQSTAEVYCTVRNITVSLMASLAASTRMMRREPGSVIHTSSPPSLKAIDAHTWHQCAYLASICRVLLSICGYRCHTISPMPNPAPLGEPGMWGKDRFSERPHGLPSATPPPLGGKRRIACSQRATIAPIIEAPWLVNGGHGASLRRHHIYLRSALHHPELARARLDGQLAGCVDPADGGQRTSG
jgi:hypothetical protein